jgi:hypothetical protein
MQNEIKNELVRRKNELGSTRLGYINLKKESILRVARESAGPEVARLASVFIFRSQTEQYNIFS